MFFTNGCHLSLKPERLWLPSQYGFLADAPQRHKATLP
jgi:hypothetical protein